MADCFLGIDIGTTNVKAAAFDVTGCIASYHAVPTPVLHPAPAFSEFPAEGLWQCICECTRSVVAEVGAQNIRAVGISAMAEGGLLADRDGLPLTDIIAWYDMRSSAQAERLIDSFGRDALYCTTGQAPSPKYGVTKLMWLAENEPALYGKARHWLTVEDFALYRLTGEYATDYSIASRTMAFDINQVAWSTAILEVAGVEGALFSPAHPGGTQVGCVTRTAAQATGLPMGMPVCTGGHDHACAAMAVDILEDGVCLDSMGTAEVSMMAVDRPALNEQSRGTYYSVYPHCGDRLYRALTSNQSCGVCVEWVRRLFDEDDYDRLLGHLTDGAGAFFLPFLRGSVECTGAHGVFWGLTDGAKRDDMVTAVIDGLCFELKRQIDGYESAFGVEAGQLRVVGGLSRSDHIMRRKSRVQGFPVSIPKNTEAACQGAALLGGIGAGLLDRNERHFVPGKTYDMPQRPEDEARYRQYLRLRKCLLDIYQDTEK